MNAGKGDRLNGSKNGIDCLLDLNDRHSRLFSSPSKQGDRHLYRSQHKLEVLAYKCMDGRLNLSVMTGTLGLITPFRNVGAKFRLGWPHLRDMIVDHYEYADREGRALLAIATYHFSRGDKERGCAGFKKDTDAARSFASDLKAQHVRVFGQGSAFYTILVGIETDLDALILHGEDESITVDLATVTETSPEDIHALLRRLYPSMSKKMMEGFSPFVEGNIKHVKEVQAANRPLIDIVHREWVLAFGRGFDWFHEPNTAIIVGTFDPELREPLATAARLLLDNLRSGRIPESDGVVVMSSAPFRRRAGYDRLAAIEKATWQNEEVMRVITEEVPELLPYVRQLTTVMDAETRKLEILHRTHLSATA